MFVNEEPAYRLLTVIVNRGKGSKVLRFAAQLGVTTASCLIGKGTIKNKTLEMMAMNEVNKEVIFMIIRTHREEEILTKLNEKFHFDKPHHGIAFTLSLAGIFHVREGYTVHWLQYAGTHLQQHESDYTLIFIVVDKGKAQDIVELSQNYGFYGGTVIKARGTASKLNIVLDMLVDPEKEAIMMVTAQERVEALIQLLDESFHFRKENTVMMVTANIHQIVGLFAERDREAK